MKKNSFLIIIVIIILLSAGFLRIRQLTTTRDTSKVSEVNTQIELEENISDETEDIEDEPILGSDRDSHGCIGSAGYAWCESKNKCLRIWEEDCPLEREESHSLLAPVEIVVSNPLPGDTISSPLEVRGRALGNWFFEAVIPISLVTEEGEEIISYYGEAESDWMSEEFVSFSGTLEFSTEAKSGYLIVEKNNPSGLKENVAQISIPVKFN